LVLVVLVQVLLEVTEQMVLILEFLVLHHSLLFGQLAAVAVGTGTVQEVVVVFLAVLVAVVEEILTVH
jgi:hypothetical protein